MNTYRDNRLSLSLFLSVLQPPAKSWTTARTRSAGSAYECITATTTSALALVLVHRRYYYLDSRASTATPPQTWKRPRTCRELLIHGRVSVRSSVLRYSRSVTPVRVLLHIHTPDTRIQAPSPHGNAPVCLRRDPAAAFSRSGSPRAGQNPCGGRNARGAGIATIYTHPLVLSPFLQTSLSLSLFSLPSFSVSSSSRFLSSSPFIPSAPTASRRVYGVSRQKRRHGVAWSRLEVSTSIESPIGWES